MTSEFDLACATCGGPLRRAEVSPESIGVEAGTALAVAECSECGGRYFPEQTLDVIGR